MRRAVWTVLAGLMVAGPAAASGIRLLTPVTEHFDDHAACVAALEAHRAHDLTLRAPRHTGPGGEVREVQVFDNGIERPGPGRAAYGSEILILHGVPDAASGRLRLYPRIELINRECEGAAMITGGMRGTLQPVLE